MPKARRVNRAWPVPAKEKGGLPEVETAFEPGKMRGSGGWCALPRGNAVFERLSNLLVDEFEREAFFEVSHHPGLDLAEHHHGFQGRAVFRGDGGARQRHVDDS